MAAWSDKSQKTSHCCVQILTGPHIYCSFQQWLYNRYYPTHLKNDIIRRCTYRQMWISKLFRAGVKTTDMRMQNIAPWFTFQCIHQSYCVIAIKYCVSARTDYTGYIQGHKWGMTVSVVLPCLGKYRMEVTAPYMNVSLRNTTQFAV